MYFSPVAWDSYAQRPHHFARHFLDRGGDGVLWVNPYPNRLPGLEDLRFRRAHPVAVSPEPRVRVVDVPAFPIEPLPGGVALNRALRWRGLLARLERETDGADLTLGVGRPSALAVLALDRLRAQARFYDAMDDFPEFYAGLSRRSMERREDEVAARVDVVYAASDALAAKFDRRGFRTIAVKNAYAMRTLPPFEPRPRGGPIVFGYVGTVARWFDWGIVAALPRAFPLAEVRIVGPVFAPRPWLPANVKVLGAFAQPEVIPLLRGFSVGLIPFRKTPLTASVDPIKFYEYRAMGLPILSTRFGQMKARGRADGVFSLEDGIEAPARAALAHVVDPEDVARFRAANDWDTRLGGVLYPDLAPLPAEGVPV